jgi:hypothetical protein
MNIPTPLPSSTVNQELVERFHQRVVNRGYDVGYLHAIFNSSLRNRKDQETLLSRLPAEVISNLSPALLTTFSETFLETLPEPVKDRIVTYRRDQQLAKEAWQKKCEEEAREEALEQVTTITEWLQNGGKKITGTAIRENGGSEIGVLEDDIEEYLPHASYKARIDEILDAISETEEVDQHINVGAALKLAKTEADYKLVFDDIRRAVARIDQAGRYDREWIFWRDQDCGLHLADLESYGYVVCDDSEAVMSPDGTKFIVTVLDGEDLLEEWNELIKETADKSND